MGTTANRRMQGKLVLLGDASVGKSSLVVRFARNEFHTNREPTIGAAFLTQKCRIPEDPTRMVKFEIWDTAGQERFSALAPMYYRNAHAAIVVYDVTQPSTFERAKFWIRELHTQATPGIVIALAGNKIDLPNASPELRKEASAYARQHNLLWFETSAKTGSNVVEMFTDIARYLPQELFERSTMLLTPDTSSSAVDLRRMSTFQDDRPNQDCAC